MFAFCPEANSTSGAFHPVMLRGMDNSIIFHNGQNKAPFPGRLAKNIVEEKKREKVVGNEDKHDNALKASPSLFSSWSREFHLRELYWQQIRTLQTSSGDG
jgi:hypothetical protein